MSDRLLVVGADGLLGGALWRYWLAAGRPVLATSLLEIPEAGPVVRLDLNQGEEAWPKLPACRAAVLCAAIAGLAQCRQQPAATRRVNVTQTLALARRLADQGCFVVFLSTNLVFDGSRPWRRADEPTCPMTEYGRQKAEAEAGLATLGDRAAVVRLTKVFHPDLPLLRGWRESLQAGRPIQPFADVVCAPIRLEATIRCLAQVAERCLPGIWQLSATADISYAAIAQRLARHGGCDPALVRPQPARTAADLEHKPRFTTLDATRAARELGFAIQSPEAVVDDALPLAARGQARPR